MAFTVADLVARLSADSSDFSAGMAGASAELKAFGAQAETQSAKAAASMKTASNIIIGAGVGAAVAIVASAKAFAAWGDQVYQLQNVTGGTAQEMSVLETEGKSLGITTSQMSTGFGFLAKAIANNATAFAKYGIATTDAKGNTLSFNQILGEAADKYRKLGGGMAGAAFAQNIFSRGGRDLIPILQEGSKGLEEAAKTAELYGKVMSQDDVDAAEHFLTAQRNLGQALDGFGITIGRAVLPSVEKMIGALSGLISFISKMPIGILPLILDFLALSGAIAGVVRVAEALGKVWGPIINGMRQMVAATVAAATSLVAYIGFLFTTAAAEGVLTAASIALEDAMIALSGPLLPIIAIGLAIVGAFVAMTQAAKTFRAEVATLESQLATGQKSIAGINAALKQQQQRLIDLGSTVKGVRGGFGLEEWQAQEHQITVNTAAIEAYRTALQTTLPELQKMISAKPIDITQPLSGTTAGQIIQAKIGGMMPDISGQLKALASVAGVSLDAVGAAFGKVAMDSKAAGVDLLDAIDQMKKSASDFRASVVSNFGGAAGALSDFMGTTRVNIDKAFGSLKTYISQIHEWGAAMREVRGTLGPVANNFLNQMQQQGLSSLPLLSQLAGKSAEFQRQFVGAFNKGNSATDSLAGMIQHTLVPAFREMIDKLTIISNIMQGLPAMKGVDHVTPTINKIHGNLNGLKDNLAKGLGPIKADPSPVVGAFHLIFNKYGGLAGAIAHNPLSVGADVNPAIAAVGGLVNYMHAMGLVRSGGGWAAIVTISETTGHQRGAAAAAAAIPPPSFSGSYTPPSFPAASGGGGGGGGAAATQQTVETLSASVATIKHIGAMLSDAASAATGPAHDAGARTLSAFVAGMVSQAGHVHDAITKTIGAIHSAVAQAIDNAKAKNEQLSASFKALRSDVVPALQEVAHAVDQIGSHLAKLKEQLASFKANIVSGFDTLKDLGGTVTNAWSDYQQQLKDYQDQLKQFAIDQAAYQSSFDTSGQPTGTAPIAPIAPTAPNFSTIIAQQVADATRLAKDLTDAATKGLNKVLLQQFASQGVAGANALEQLVANPALIAQLNAASTAISTAAGTTADALGDKFFGESIKKAGHQFDVLSNRLDKFTTLLSGKLHDGTNEVGKALHALANTLGVLSGLHFPALGGGGGGEKSDDGTISSGGTTFGTPVTPQAPAPVPQPGGPPYPGGESPPGHPHGSPGPISFTGATFHFHGIEDVPSFFRAMQEMVQKDTRVNGGSNAFANKS